MTNIRRVGNAHGFNYAVQTSSKFYISIDNIFSCSSLQLVAVASQNGYFWIW
ncbi:MAG: hypothetical protein LH613_09215 [Chamaesiphon sp.]|nr:hypothetical protein [Chamaesiphon sp.]